MSEKSGSGGNETNIDGNSEDGPFDRSGAMSGLSADAVPRWKWNSASTPIYHMFGMDVSRRDNIIVLDDTEILYVAGSCVVLFDVRDKKRRYVYGSSGGGIGCIKANRARERLFVGEKGTQPNAPNIVAFDLPSFEVAKKMSGGAEEGYACMDLNRDETMLCSVATSPDYSLTVWDWQNGQIILRTKAFGQDVFKVAFSPFVDGRITTSGNGHIRFWKMAETFTGLKLQGDIGKFGKVDLSDVEAFAELPNGNVVSGSDTGHLLLWEGGFVKCRFVTVEANDAEPNGDSCAAGSPAHCGGVYYIKYELHDEMPQIVSAGADGQIRWWDATVMQGAEVDFDQTIDFAIKPLKSFCTGKDVIIKDISKRSRESSNVIVLDGRGSLLEISLESADISPTWNFHGGPLAGVASSPVEHIAVTASEDGSVRCCNYLKKESIASTRCEIGCTCVCWHPTSTAGMSRVVYVGFADGVLRCFYIAEKEFVLRDATRPHTEAVRCITFTSDGRFVSTCSDDGTIFVFNCAASIEEKCVLSPVGFFTCGPVLSMCWKLNDLKLLYTTEKGRVFEADLNSHLDMSKSQDQADTFLLDIEPNLVNLGLKHITSRSEDDQIEDSDAGQEHHCVCAVYDSSGSTITWTDRSGKCIEYDMESEGEVVKFDCGCSAVKSVALDQNSDILIFCTNDGSVFLSQNSASGECFAVRKHDTDSTVSATLSWDGNFVLSAGTDGLFAVHRLDADRTFATDVTETQENSHLSRFFCTAANVEGSTEQPDGFVHVTETVERNILDSMVSIGDRTKQTKYSIQEEKIKKKKDALELTAKRKKNAIIRVVSDLRKEFTSIVKENEALPAVARLSDDALRVDADFVIMMEKEKEKAVAEVQKECEYDSELSALRRKKLEGMFVDILDHELFVVSGLRSATPAVQSFPARKIHPQLLFHRNKSADDESTREISCIGMGKEVRREETAEDNQNTVGSDDHPQKDQLGRKSTFSYRKMMRAQRKQKVGDKAKDRPDENEDNPGDMAAIQNARANLGDYKFKSNDAPGNRAQDRLEEFAAIESAMHSIKSAFNERLSSARDEKRRLSAVISAKIDRVKFINEKLNETSDVLDNEMCGIKLMSSDGSENPSGINSREEDKSPSNQEISAAKSELLAENDQPSEESKGSLPLRLLLPVLLPSTFESDSLQLDADNLSPVEKDEIQERRLLLRHEKEAILQEVHAMCAKFDDTMYELRKERHQLATELKAAELHLLQLAVAVKEKKPESSIVPLTTRQLFLWQDQEENGRTSVLARDETCHRRIFSDAPKDCIVFRNQELAKLRQRIVDLGREISREKQELKNLKREKVRLDNESKTKMDEIQMQEERCKELQHLKFGQLVDIDELDKICVGSNGEAEFKEKADAAKVNYEHELSKRLHQQQSLKEQLFKATNENTAILQQIAELSDRQLQIEREFSKNVREPVAEDNVEKEEEEECKKLEAVASAQAKEIDRLKKEISAMKRKDGHLYAPLPLRPSGHKRK